MVFHSEIFIRIKGNLSDFQILYFLLIACSSPGWLEALKMHNRTCSCLFSVCSNSGSWPRRFLWL